MEEPLDDKLYSLTTFELAMKLATGQFSEQEKFIALDIIYSREKKDGSIFEAPKDVSITKKSKPPLPGSKTEKIYNLLAEGKSPKQVMETLKKKKVTVYFPEIYRVGKIYFPDKFAKKN
jgi:IS30 family transposase